MYRLYTQRALFLNNWWLPVEQARSLCVCIGGGGGNWATPWSAGTMWLWFKQERCATVLSAGICRMPWACWSNWPCSSTSATFSTSATLRMVIGQAGLLQMLTIFISGTRGVRYCVCVCFSPLPREYLININTCCCLVHIGLLLAFQVDHLSFQ